MDHIIERKIASINVEFTEKLKNCDRRIRRAKSELAKYATLAATHCRALDVACTDERITGWKTHYEENLANAKSVRDNIARIVRKMRDSDYAEGFARQVLSDEIVSA